MSISSLEDRVQFEKFWIDGDRLIIKVREKKTPIERHQNVSEKLANATSKELAMFEVLGDGEGVHWPLLDEDLSAAFLIFPEKFRAKAKKHKSRRISGTPKSLQRASSRH